jgi:hypothetical protein
MLKTLLLPAMACLLLADSTARAREVRAMIEVRLPSGRVEGRPLDRNERERHLLARDGRWLTFRIDAAEAYAKTADRFEGYSRREMRARLQAEFGRAFDVTGAGHYLVVHPRGQSGAWAERFERLYRSFRHYFQVRGARLSDPPYPLVAVVFAGQQDYLRYAASIGAPVRPDFLGHYSRKTNRVYLFDSPDERAATILHEAAHQAAFNTGVHGRFHATPRWLAEGLAMMFETPGVWQTTANSARRDRILPGRLADFRRYVAAGRPSDSLRTMLADDQFFARAPEAAYAQAWAFSFYLCETRPREYASYLARTAARPDFERYSPDERLADFTAVFGNDWELLDAQFLRYIGRLR